MRSKKIVADSAVFGLKIRIHADCYAGVLLRKTPCSKTARVAAWMPQAIEVEVAQTASLLFGLMQFCHLAKLHTGLVASIHAVLKQTDSAVPTAQQWACALF
ncbi:MAG: hypothetical protein LBC72_02850 [Spirochaetaceae bacterium]|nr:hypothetical protein [Spirochaetaceae bacterium]